MPKQLTGSATRFISRLVLFIRKGDLRGGSMFRYLMARWDQDCLQGGTAGPERTIFSGHTILDVDRLKVGNTLEAK
jgi:hypothetical protein